MKHLLILLSLLFLTFPLVAQETGDLYFKKVNGKYGWFKNGDDKKDWIYVGEIKKRETKWNWGIKFYFWKIFWRSKKMGYSMDKGLIHTKVEERE